MAKVGPVATTRLDPDAIRACGSEGLRAGRAPELQLARAARGDHDAVLALQGAVGNRAAAAALHGGIPTVRSRGVMLARCPGRCQCGGRCGGPLADDEVLDEFTRRLQRAVAARRCQSTNEATVDQVSPVPPMLDEVEWNALPSDRPGSSGPSTWVQRDGLTRRADTRAGPARGGNDAQRRPRAVMLQRLAYWAEFNPDPASKGWRSGTWVHHQVLPQIGLETGRHGKTVFTEAPVPQADRNKSGPDDIRGYADFYKATTTVGVEFPAHQSPRQMPSGTYLRLNGRTFKHLERSAPRLPEGSTVLTDVARAPPEIALGDLKGGIDSVPTAEASDQLKNYMDGFRLAGQYVSAYVDPDGKKPPAWKPGRRLLHANEVIVPPYYTPGHAHEQPSVRLVLIDAYGKPDFTFSSRHRVSGKLYVFADPNRTGVWVYTYAPDQEIPLGELPQHVRDLGPEVETRLRTPLLTPPLARKLRSGAQARCHGPPALPRNRALRLVVARQQQDAVDPFDYGKWLRAQTDLGDRVGGAQHEPAVEDAEAAQRVEEANENVRKLGLRAPKVSQGKLTGGQTVKEIKFWTGTTGKVLGKFRHLFGRAFTTIANLYIKLRDRIRGMLSRSVEGKSFGGGLPGAAFKAAYAVVKGAARYIVTKTAERLRTSLVEGTKKKLMSLIGPAVEAVEAKVHDTEEMVSDLEDEVLKKIEGVFDGITGVYTSIIKEIEDIKSIVGKITDIVDKVRWGARVIECLSPPGIGCLWILAQSVLEDVAARVVETCWFKRNITPLINGLSWVKQLPDRLAKAIRDALVGLLPGPLQDVFDEIDTDPVEVGESDIGCDLDDDPERDRLTAERRAMWDLLEAVGEDRWDALVEAFWAAGASFNTRLTAAEIYRAKDIIVRSHVTAKQLRDYAKYYAPFADKRRFGPLGEFVTAVAGQGPQMPDIVGETEATDGGGNGNGAGTATEAVPTDAPGPRGEVIKYEFVNIGKFGRDVQAGKTLTLDVTVKIRGRLFALRNVPLVIQPPKPQPDHTVQIVLTPKKDIIFEYGGHNTGEPAQRMTLSKTSKFWRTFPAPEPHQPTREPALQP